MDGMYVASWGFTRKITVQLMSRLANHVFNPSFEQTAYGENNSCNWESRKHRFLCTFNILMHGNKVLFSVECTVVRLLWKCYHIEPVTGPVHLESTLSFLNLYRISKENSLCDLKCRGKTQNGFFFRSKALTCIVYKSFFDNLGVEEIMQWCLQVSIEKVSNHICLQDRS